MIGTPYTKENLMPKSYASKTLALLLTSAVSLTALTALAADNNTGSNKAETANTLNTPDRNLMQDDAYVTLTGKVASVTENDAFQLDYGKGVIRVDTNDGRSNIFQGADANAGNVLREGDQVTVTGRIDNNWFSEREIDAH